MFTVGTREGEEMLEQKWGLLDSFVACALCGAAVPDADEPRRLHGEWHERLRRAVDETEMLG